MGRLSAIKIPIRIRINKVTNSNGMYDVIPKLDLSK